MRCSLKYLPLAAVALVMLTGLASGQQLPTPPSISASSTNLADLSLDQLLNVSVETVYGASRYEQKETSAPASVTVVTADDIKKFGYRTLAEVLRSVRGFYVTYERNYNNVGIRGFDRPGDFNTRVLLLVDGHRMNDPLYSSALIGPEAIVDVDLIERVEVIRGPGSSLYGDNAFFGVINVITRSGRQIHGAEASVSAASLDTYGGRFTVGNLFTNQLELLLSGSYFDSAGNNRLFFREFDDPQDNHGVAVNSDAESYGSLFGQLGYHELTLSAAYSRRDKHVPTASFGTVFNDGREKTVDERYYGDLKLNHSFNEEVSLLARAYYDFYGYRANYPYNFATPPAPRSVVVTHDDDYGDAVGAELQLTSRLFDRHTLVLGTEYRQDLDLFQSNYQGNPRVYNFSSNQTGWSYGLYGQGEIVLRPNLLLNAGLRFDDYYDFGSTVNPRLGLIYSPWERTTFKALYGQAYRAPNAYELYLESPGFIESNPHLDPETIRTYELVCEQGLPWNLYFTTDLYYDDIKNLITQETDPANGMLVFENVQDVHAKGIEFELEGRYAHGLRARASYALQRAEDADSGEELNNSPRHLAKFNLVVPLYKEKVFGGLELQYTSSLKTLAGNRTSGFVIVNATLFSQQLLKNLELSASIYNLFDQRYAYPGSTGNREELIPQDGRGFRVKLTYRF